MIHGPVPTWCEHLPLHEWVLTEFGSNCEIFFWVDKFLLAENFSCDVIVLVTNDVLPPENQEHFLLIDPGLVPPDYNRSNLNSCLANSHKLWHPRKSRPPDINHSIMEKTARFPDKRFLIINSCINLTDTVNLTWVSWAPVWLTIDYQIPCTVPSKSFQDGHVWVSLSNRARVHRSLAAMMLLGMDLETTGFLSVNADNVAARSAGSWDQWVSWWYHSDHEEIHDVQQYFPVLEKGFHKLLQGQGYHRKPDGPTMHHSQGNFDRSLWPLFYHRSVIEIINESIWQPNAGGAITEKYIHSVYAHNFPIMIAVQHAVRSQRQLGFDLFDDVIDHSYDSIESPTLRLVSAIEKNQRILRDWAYATQCWHACQDRMRRNVELANTLLKNPHTLWAKHARSASLRPVDQKTQ